MIDLEKLNPILEGYKLYFPSHWDDEKYKWEAIKHFQDHWNIDAKDFGEMFKQATDKTFNLLVSGYAYPRGMIINFAKVDNEATRAMFRNLFDESQDLAARVDAFQTASEELRARYDDGTWRNHYQNTNAISTYLWLRYPDKYYIYKYELFRSTAKELSSDYMPKRNGSVDSLIGGIQMYDEICEAIKSDPDIPEMIRDVLTSTCYPDPELKTTTIDVGFFVSRFYNQEKEIDLDGLRSAAKFSKWYAPVIDTLYKMGGKGKRPDIHQKIIEDYGITDDELKVVNSTGIAKVLNDIDWARNYLVYEGFIDKNEGGVWSLTDLGKTIIITDELASKLTAKWIKIKTAEREHRYIPEIDLSPYYVCRENDAQNSNIPYTKEDFLSQVYMEAERYDTLVALLQNKKNLILQGAPGVGKTFVAKRLACSMMGEKDESRIEFIQFHQNYSYEDFIMGYRPDGSDFKLSYGIFYRFCQTAANHPDKEFFFIIDEINRGNMSKIFGELLMLIEKDYRGTKATLAYSGLPFSVPKNLYIIGMMNTADRSLAMIDYALRRRFSFFEIEPGFSSEGFMNYQKTFENETFNALIAQIKILNKEITEDKSLGRGFQIGHSYFCGREERGVDEEWMRSVVEFDILPMLSEYWFDELVKLQRWEKNLRGVFDD